MAKKWTPEGIPKYAENVLQCAADFAKAQAALTAFRRSFDWCTCTPEQRQQDTRLLEKMRETEWKLKSAARKYKF